jgi:uncharacterized protein
MNVAPVELLVFQPTPFCNLDCSYCYLPQRTNRRTMTVETVQVTVERLFQEDLLSPEVSVIWHSGEPLVVKPELYREYFKVIREVAGSKVTIRHCIQTNATLIDETWCDFFREHDVHIGVSIDGPAEVHNFSRLSRSGRGSFAQTIQGIQRLQAKGVPFHTISVVTSASLPFSEEIYAFLTSLGPDYIAFNVEEQEGVNSSSSLQGKAESVEAFFRSIYHQAKAADFRLPIREFESAWESIMNGRGAEQNSQIWPYRVFIVDVAGEFTTFSPELLGMRSDAYGAFCLGNVLTDSPRAIARSKTLQHLFKEVQAGVRLCEDTCQYFDLCGGGAPSNKLFETGTFATAVTRFCTDSIQLPLRIVLEDLETTLAQGRSNCSNVQLSSGSSFKTSP